VVVIVLCVNGGSSSVKLALFDGDERIASGTADGIGLAQGRLRVAGARGSPPPDEPRRFDDHRAAVETVLGALQALGLPAPAAAAHRFVHGGPDHHAPSVIEDPLLAALREAVPFAPLHLPAELLAVEAVEQRHAGLPQIACFDTHFHWDMPEVARRLPIPRRLHDQGVRRYGFHGISYEWIVESIGDRLGRAVLAHLGNGASLCAVRAGRSIDTTMGFTPTGGIPMGTRTGDLDPGVLVYLAEARGYGPRDLARLVDRESGLLGVSGLTSDMQALLAARGANPHAALAVDLFCYQARKAVGALAAALGGLDTLVFTGGIGEHATAVREGICAGLTHLGVQFDASRNESSETIVSAAASACTVRIVAADEERMLSRHAHRMLGDGPPSLAGVSGVR
jgi:acetate kinase